MNKTSHHFLLRLSPEQNIIRSSPACDLLLSIFPVIFSVTNLTSTDFTILEPPLSATLSLTNPVFPNWKENPSSDLGISLFSLAVDSQRGFLGFEIPEVRWDGSGSGMLPGDHNLNFISLSFSRRPPRARVPPAQLPLSGNPLGMLIHQSPSSLKTRGHSSLCDRALPLSLFLYTLILPLLYNLVLFLIELDFNYQNTTRLLIFVFLICTFDEGRCRHYAPLPASSLARSLAVGALCLDRGSNSHLHPFCSFLCFFLCFLFSEISVYVSCLVFLYLNLLSL